MELGPIQKSWVEALRSGQYQQGTKYLCRNEKYCCLGVACELAIQAGITVSSSLDGIQKFYMPSGVPKESTPPIAVQDWLKMKTNLGQLPSGYDLARYNDEGRTFEQIAEMIEVNAHILFTEPA